MFEDILYNINNGINIENTLKLIDNYKINNKLLIDIKNEQLYDENIRIEQNIKDNEEYIHKKYQYNYEFDKNEIIYKQNQLKSDNERKINNDNLLLTIPILVNNNNTLKMNENNNIHTINRPNLIQIICNKRLLPKIIKSNEVIKNEIKELGLRQSEITRMTHLAGGYEFSVYNYRNWQEILNGIGQIDQKLHENSNEMNDETTIHSEYMKSWNSFNNKE